MRQNINHNPALKVFESYLDFSGGLNSEISNERLRENEFPVFENLDLRGRGSAKRRYGRRDAVTSYPYNAASSKAQGIFPFYKGGDVEPDLIIAVGGRIYVMRQGTTVITEIGISNNAGGQFTFQTDLPIDAVQYRENMFIATGTKLCELKWDTAANNYVAKIVEPYKPTGQEAIQIGFNALADNPSTWIQQKEGSSANITGIIADKKTSAPNVNTRFVAYVEKPSNIPVNYKWEVRKTGTGSFSTVKGDTPDNFMDYTFNEIGGYDIRASLISQSRSLWNGEGLWSGTQSGVNQQISTGSLDSPSTDGKALILTSTGGDYSKDVAWLDFSPAVDFSQFNAMEFWWSTYSQGTQFGFEQGDIQMYVYTETSPAVPTLVVNNKGTGDMSRQSSRTAYNKATLTFDSSLQGLDKVTRIAFRTKISIGALYMPFNPQDYDPTKDTCTKIAQIKVYRTDINASYTLSNYEVLGSLDPSKDPDTYKAIHTSRIIRLHWDRLILGRDNKYPSQMYISDLNNPRYFPTDNRIDFSLERQESISGIVRYRNMLVVFTATTINALTGTSPQDYQKVLIHNEIGSVAERSVQVVGNDVFFLSREGLYKLRPDRVLALDQLNVARVDAAIQTEMSKLVGETNACATFTDGQYWINFPDHKIIYRYYTTSGAWVKDTSKPDGSYPLQFSQFYSIGESAYNLSVTGRLYKHDRDVYTDNGEAYIMAVESKMLDQSATFNYKKLKKLHILSKLYANHKSKFYVTIYADSVIALTPTEGHAEIVNGNVLWVATTAPNVQFPSGSSPDSTWLLGDSLLGDVQLMDYKTSVRGKCRRMKIRIEHLDPDVCELYGFGLEFKLKKA